MFKKIVTKIVAQIKFNNAQIAYGKAAWGGPNCEGLEPLQSVRDDLYVAMMNAASIAIAAGSKDELTIDVAKRSNHYGLFASSILDIMSA